MAKYRLDTMLESETLDALIEKAKTEKRSKSAMASNLIELGMSHEKDLVSFGNYLLKKYNVVTDGVADWYLDKWRNA